MLHCATSRNLSRDWDLVLNSEFLLATQQKYCEMRCKRDAMAKNALQQQLRKVEPDSTSCNASCNKDVA